MAKAYTWIGFLQGESVNDYYIKAKTAALKALEIDDLLSEAHASIGYIKYLFEWDWNGSEASLLKAIELNPLNPQTHFLYSNSLRARGLFDRSVQEIKLALDLDPLARNLNHNYGLTLRTMGKVEDAIHQFRKTLELYPENTNTLLWLGMCFLDKGELDKAFSLIEKVLNNHPQTWRPFTLGFAGYAYGVGGLSKKAQAILDVALQKDRDAYFSPHIISLIYNGLGDEDKMFEYLNKACDQKDPYQYTLKSIPSYKKYHSDPRFIFLMKRMGLEG